MSPRGDFGLCTGPDSPSTQPRMIGPNPGLDDRQLSTAVGKVDDPDTLTLADAHVASCHHDCLHKMPPDPGERNSTTLKWISNQNHVVDAFLGLGFDPGEEDMVGLGTQGPDNGRATGFDRIDSTDGQSTGHWRPHETMSMEEEEMREDDGA